MATSINLSHDQLLFCVVIKNGERRLVLFNQYFSIISETIGENAIYCAWPPKGLPLNPDQQTPFPFKPRHAGEGRHLIEFKKISAFAEMTHSLVAAM